jgi:hypothetical protein
MKQALVLLVIALLAMPGALAASRSYQIVSPYSTTVRTPGNVYNQTTLVPKHFVGLQGIVGVSVEPEKKYGPQRKFGRKDIKRLAALAPVRPGYVGIGGVAFGAGPNASVAPCAAFNCKPHQYVVADASTKTYYRCYCPAAKNIAPENVKCIDTPGIGDKMGYRAGAC